MGGCRTQSVRRPLVLLLLPLLLLLVVGVELRAAAFLGKPPRGPGQPPAPPGAPRRRAGCCGAVACREAAAGLAEDPGAARAEGADTYAGLASSLEGRARSGCSFLEGAAVAHDAAQGYYSLAATRDLPAGTVVLDEQRLPESEVPGFLHPRTADDIPPCVMGFPLALVPRVVFEASPSLMSSLRVSLNSYGPLSLYGLGTAANHACAPTARRVTSEDGLSSIVTTEAVAAGDEITLSYLPDLGGSPRWRRQLEIFWRYGFWCRCRRCESRRPAPEGTGAQPAAVQEAVLAHRRSLQLAAGRRPAGTRASAAPAASGRWQRTVQLMPLAALQTLPLALLSAAARLLADPLPEATA